MREAQLCFQTYPHIISPAKCSRDEGWSEEVKEGENVTKPKQGSPLGDHVQTIIVCVNV